MMPVMTGMDLYAEVVRVAPKLVGRFVFMTGGAFTPRARAFLESVNNPCLEKPLDTSKLRSIVARAGEGLRRARSAGSLPSTLESDPRGERLELLRR